MILLASPEQLRDVVLSIVGNHKVSVFINQQHVIHDYGTLTSFGQLRPEHERTKVKHETCITVFIDLVDAVNDRCQVMYSSTPAEWPATLEKIKEHYLPAHEPADQASGLRLAMAGRAG